MTSERCHCGEPSWETCPICGEPLCESDFRIHVPDCEAEAEKNAP